MTAILGRRSRRTSTIVAVTAATVLGLGGLAHADIVKNAVEGSTGVGGHEVITVGGSTTILYYIDNTGQDCDASDGSPVTVTISTPSEVTATPSSLLFSECGSATSNTQSVIFTSSTPSVAEGWHIDTSASDTNGDYVTANADFHLVVKAADDGGGGSSDRDGDGIDDGSDNCPDNANADQADADEDGAGNACDTNSYPPAVGSQADDANGNEGSTLTTGGSFTDQDSDSSLDLSVPSGTPGTFTDNGDGTFSWSLDTTDDTSGSVTVTASDGEHADASMTFNYTASNVAPSVNAPVVTRTGACSTSVSSSFTDPGSGDTHSASIAWGDSSSSTVDPATSPVTGSHTYTANGTYTIMVTVTDDDGGSGSASASGGNVFTTMNVPTGFYQPIRANGTRTVFKLGSTIPLKIKVNGCDGLRVTNLSPTVNLTKLDSTAPYPVNETPAAAVPTNGKNMRWTDTQYLYNLSTKRSVFNDGADLTAGTYRVWITDASFYSGVSADIDLTR